MKILIAGGTGLIGRALADSLLSDKHDVILLTRNPKRVKDAPDGVQLVAWDGRTGASWASHAEGATAIVNLAGASLDHRWTEAYKQEIKDSRVQAGQAITEAVRLTSDKPKVVLQASAVGYYGPHQDTVLTESSPAGSDFLADVCKAWEASTEQVEGLGVRRAIIRTGIVLSTQGGAMAKLLPLFKFFVGGPVGSGKQYYSWIHLADEVESIRYLIEENAANGVYNLTAPNPVTNKEFARALGKALNRPSFAPAPAPALKLLFGEMSTIILDGQRVIPKRLQESGYMFRFHDPEAAMRHLLYSGYEG